MSRRALAWAVALTLLAAALVFFNLPQERSAMTANDYISNAPAGHEVGEQPPDFTLPCLDGTAFTLSEHRGQVTVINLWATWCGPCVKELPVFDQYLREHPNGVSILAIHSSLITDDVDEYLSHYDYQLSFAIDGDGAVIESLGGSTMLPQTIVIDPYGVVSYNKVGSMDYETLQRLIEETGA